MLSVCWIKELSLTGVFKLSGLLKILLGVLQENSTPKNKQGPAIIISVSLLHSSPQNLKFTGSYKGFSRE